MRKISLLITFFGVAFFSFSQSISGKWNFQSILPDTIKAGENLKNISDGDAMQINEDGSFHYEIAKENLIANGSWELVENNLSLHYILPDNTTRNYQITTDKTSLVLNENGINFSFQKDEVKPEIITTSGVTLTSIFRGLLGLISLLLIAFLFSRNRKGIDWKLVGKGLGIQFLFALLILKIPIVSSGFEFIGKIFTKINKITRKTNF